jgi:hypothetical protein
LLSAAYQSARELVAGVGGAVPTHGYGKQPLLNTTDANQLRRAYDMSDDELARIASGDAATAPAEQRPADPKKMN